MTERSLYIPTRSDKLGLQVEVTRTLADVKTDFQRVEVLDTLTLGKVLLLDGHVQLSELDERAYHESLVHIPLSSVDSPNRTLVVGGGDGGVIRELCRYSSIQHIDMVEIDAGVVDVCKEHLPFVSGGAFDDPRVCLRIEDAFAFVKSVDEPYDMIVVDCTDVYEEEDDALSQDLFTPEFYEDLRRLLKKGGFIVSQADNLVFCPYSTESALAKFQAVLPTTGQYWCLVPSFGGYSGFVWGSHGATLRTEFSSRIQGLTYLNDVTYALSLSRVPFESPP